MPTRENRWELPLLLATAGLGVTAVTMLFSSVQYMEGISRSAENNVVYEVMTTAPELARFQMSVAARFLPGASVTDDEVMLRFEILENRMEVLGTGESRRLRQDSAEATALIQRMQQAVRSIAPRMHHLAAPADAVAVLKTIEPLNSAAARLAALTTSNAATRIADNKAVLIRIFWQLLAEILGLLACGIVLICLLRRARRLARRSAHYDVLTELPNRLSFNSELAVQCGSRDQASTLVVMMLDLDLFKHVNDTLGHPAGDRLLRIVAERLSQVLADAVVFARLGGDEFAAILRSPEPEAVARATADRILETFREPFDLFGTVVSVSASVGIAIAGIRDEEPEALLKNADLALYAVKENRRGGFQLYQPALRRAYAERQTLAKDLETALANEELELHFQPVVSLETGWTSSFEALLRWRHPTRGWVSPATFIPIAEDTAQIIPIGRWVIAEACATVAQWPEEVGIAVNLSARQFVDSQLKATILDALATHGVRPARLTLEITESVLIQNDHLVIATLNALRETGILIALDDFGTGYASLSYLTRFPFDTIKIDQSFVRGSPDHHDSLTIVETICDLAARLGLSTVAEGIETAEQWDMIRAAGCQNGQGYLFDRPMPAAECATRLSLERLRRIRASGQRTAAADPLPVHGSGRER